MTTATASEQDFRRLVGPHRAELHAHCYRMLGSVQDAEDALQEVMLRAWRGLAGFEGRSSVRSWLHRIATNVCLDQLARRSRRVLPVDLGPPADPHADGDAPPAETAWIEPYPDERLGLADGSAEPEARYEQRESVELAFVAAVQHLPATQRAVLLLRDVLGFSAREAAESLGTTVGSANSALQRARRALAERLPERSQQATLRALGDERTRALVERYTSAWEDADVDAIVAMLAEEATWAMPPSADWYRGTDAIRDFVRVGPIRVRWRHLPTRVNGQLAVGCYAWHAEQSRYEAFAIDVLTLDGELITDITAFIEPAAFARFGLPTDLPASAPTARAGGGAGG